MAQIPRQKTPDSTIALAKDGYEFISKRCHRFQSDIFQTRLMFQKTICMKGENAARQFYDKEYFKREGVAPSNIKATLFGEGGVQGLDDEAHLNRKQMFMSLMAENRLENISVLFSNQWQTYTSKWAALDSVVLFTEVKEIICRAICEWTGVPLDEEEVPQRTNDLAAMIDGSGSIGQRHWKARSARKRSEEWISDLIKKIRTEELDVAKGSAIHTFATHRDLNGNLLNEQIAAVELLNILRPSVAVSRYIIFSALALHQYPEYRQKLLDDEHLLPHFVNEVRRFYPFFPFVAAIVRKDFTWNGYSFPSGRRVLLDLYGTNHDADLWKNPGRFRPERFAEREPGSFDLIPQGGGSHHHNHRCAGEWITLAMMKTAVNLLTKSIQYEVPDQNLQIDLSRIPAIPESRFIIKNVQLLNR